jgi:hypothetical protein
MQQPVPYTPKAVQLIRNGASAADLGWSETMYHSVCASHGLEEVKGARKSAKAAAISLPVVAAPNVQVDVQFSASSREVIRAGICVALTRVQTKVFGVLFDRHSGGLEDFINASGVAELLGKDTSPQNIRDLAARLSANLTPLKMWIETKHGPTGGFRLRVDA